MSRRPTIPRPAFPQAVCGAAVLLVLILSGCVEGSIGDAPTCPDAETDVCPSGDGTSQSDTPSGSDTTSDPSDTGADTGDPTGPIGCDDDPEAGCPCDFQDRAIGICSEGTLDDKGNCQKPSAYQDDENECDGKDNDCNGIVDEGCRCDYEGKSEGVCEDAGTKDDQGNCPKPSTYEPDEISCKGLDNDCDGSVDEGCGCNYQNKSTGVCSGGKIGPMGDCQAPMAYEQDEQSCDGKDNDCDGLTDESDGPIACTPGEKMTESCGACGEKVRTCQSNCTWGTFSGCQSKGQCTPGETQSDTCGNCGTQTRNCTQNCTWGAWSGCSGEGVCSPGTTDDSGCPTCRAKSCTSNCSWSSSCTECTCSGFQQCGFSCPDGYHVSRKTCDFSCGSCGTSDNAVYCEPNCGASFTKCGYSCPDGYHQTRQTCDFSCGSCGTSDNAVTCSRN